MSEEEELTPLLERVLSGGVGRCLRERPVARQTSRQSVNLLTAWYGRVPQLSDPRVREDVLRRLTRDIAQIESAVTRQLARILHHPEFQKLESAWRSLDQLVSNVDHEQELAKEAGVSIKLRIRLLNVTQDELADDLENAIAFDESQLFRKVYEQEFGQPGGEPYGVLIGDYEFTNHPRDVQLLQRIAGVSASAFAPFIASASPELLGLESFGQLSQPINFKELQEGKKYLLWRAFRERDDDARFVGLTVPRILLRGPYRDDGSQSFGFRFDEARLGPGQSHLWGSAAFALGFVIARSFAHTGWFAKIRGLSPGGGSGLFPGSVTAEYTANPKATLPKPVTDVVITEATDRILSDLGFIPLCQSKDFPTGVFRNTPSLQEPAHFDDENANASARLSGMLQYTLCVSRFAHYLKTMIRDRTGGWANASELERELRVWINRYVTEASDDDSVKARKPLREAKVEIQETLPGQFRMTMWLRPHFQLEDLQVALRLNSRLESID